MKKTKNEKRQPAQDRQAEAGERRRGRVSVHRRGFGFVRTDVPGGDTATRQEEGVATSAFVPPPSLADYLDGDLVEATFVAEKDGRYLATDLELVERARDRLFGEVVVARGGRRRLEVDPQVASRSWPLRGGQDLADGTLVVAEVDGEQAVRPQVVPEDEASLRRVLVRWSLRDGHPGRVKGAARRLKARRSTGRRDLRDVPTVTIDGPSTRDIDDAVSVLAPAQADGSIRVLISIADVDAWVDEGSAVDREARARGTSVYLPDRVIPMIPRVLSEERTSLLPGVDRAVLTAELRIDPEGAVRSCDVYEAVIQSDARLTYDAVATFLDEGSEDAVPQNLHESLRWLRAAVGRLSAVRVSRGGLTIDRDEAELVFDDDGDPIDVELRDESSAHRLIERLMVAANEAVAHWLHERGLPALYRVHPAPEPSRLTDLATVAANFGFETAFGDRLTPRAVAAFEAQFATSTAAPALRSVLRRTLGPARYTVHAGSHFGLAAPLYLHFTSPIRRYADLVVHRIVKRHLRGDRDQQAGDPALEELAVRLNELAFRAGKAESERLRMLAARLFASRCGERFAGRVISVRPFGLIVLLEGVGVSGLVPIEELPGKGWQLDPTRQTLTRGRGQRARSFAVGAPIQVRIADASEEEGQIDLSLVGP